MSREPQITDVRYLLIQDTGLGSKAQRSLHISKSLPICRLIEYFKLVSRCAEHLLGEKQASRLGMTIAGAGHPPV